jgi:signal transduction histidine kinase
MEMIHRGSDIVIEVRAGEALRFRGERADLEEMLGNLVDNACKWASSRVTIEVLRERRNAASQEQVLRFVIDDDGRGLSPSEREQAGRRGRRLDETKPGSGLGLSIVVELAGLYGGALKLGAAPLGGLRAELVLPAGRGDTPDEAAGLLP